MELNKKHLLSSFLLPLIIASVCLSSCASVQRRSINQGDLQTDLKKAVVALLESYTGSGKPGVIITPFISETGQETMVNIYNTLVVPTVFNSGRFRIIERENLDRLLKEKSIHLSGLAETTNAKEFGTLLGADYIISFKIQKQVLTLKMVSVKDGVVTGYTTVTQPAGVGYELFHNGSKVEGFEAAFFSLEEAENNFAWNKEQNEKGLGIKVTGLFNGEPLKLKSR